MNGTWRCFPGETPPVAVQLQPVGKVFRLFPCADQLHDGKELLVAIIFLLLLQHKHKWKPKHDCIMTQSTAPGKLMSVARKTISSPCSVVMDLCWCSKWGMTASRDPCHLQEAPGQGQEYGRNSQSSSCSALSVCGRVTSQPDEAYLHGKSTELATFSMAKLRIEPRGPLQVGQQVSLGRQLLQTKWPLWPRRMGGST